MVKNAIQEERMKKYFIEATKEILKGEGLSSVNVRGVAQKAGYSFATIYNYFTDVKDLVFECVKDFLIECEEIIQNETLNVARGKDKIKAITKSYVKYFIQYPGTFELFFIEKPINLAGKQNTIEMIDLFYARICKDEWQYLVENNSVTADTVELKQAQLKYIVLGMLLLYINRRQPSDYAKFIDDLETQINSVLG